MPSLDRSQQEFCRSVAPNIRLLAPAGCGKTSSLLYRCRELAQRAKNNPRFLIVTFTVTASNELKERLSNDPEFESVRDQAMVTTLNSYGWRSIRRQVNNPKLLKTNNDRHFAMRNQLRPEWLGNQHIEPVINKPGNGARILMTVMDNLKSMGFDHTKDTKFDNFNDRLIALENQGLSWRIKEQFGILTQIGVLDSSILSDKEVTLSSCRDFYNRFFTFWQKATESLLGQLTFTFEDQKYWTYLDLKSPGPNGKRKPFITGAAQYKHILVDEFQDINPLDLELIKTIAQRNRSTLTIVGDDDQAIFEWRGATPEYILHPGKYFSGIDFRDYQLEVNYRSPSNIVEHSQRLIANNQNRVAKKVRSAENVNTAKIEIVKTDDINHRLKLVTDIVRSTEPGKVAVIGRLRSHLIPFQIYFVSDGAPFKTVADLEVFASQAFNDLVKLLEIWSGSQEKRRTRQVVDDTIKICDLIRRRPFSKKDSRNMSKHLTSAQPITVKDAVSAIKDYSAEKLSGKTHRELHKAASEFVMANQVSDAIRVIAKEFDGLQFDFERAEDDVFYTAPPLEQLAGIAEGGNLDANDLIDRIEKAQQQIQEYQNFEDDTADANGQKYDLERPLHLMTAHRSKGKEFDTVILLDTVEGVWPHGKTDDQRQMEAERRLFYVAFTRARKRVVMLTDKNDGPISSFVEELNLEQQPKAGV